MLVHVGRWALWAEAAMAVYVVMGLWYGMCVWCSCSFGLFCSGGGRDCYDRMVLCSERLACSMVTDRRPVTKAKAEFERVEVEVGWMNGSWT